MTVKATVQLHGNNYLRVIFCGWHLRKDFVCDFIFNVHLYPRHGMYPD